MNMDQATGILRAVVPALCAYLVGKGWIPAGSVADITAAIVAVAAALWSVKTHTDSSKLAAVEAMPEVAKIVVTPTASTEAVALAAADPSRPKVST